MQPLGAFPQGWDETRVGQLLQHNETQTEDDAVAEDETAFAASDTVMSVSRELVAQVREPIAKNKSQS